MVTFSPAKEDSTNEAPQERKTSDCVEVDGKTESKVYDVFPTEMLVELLVVTQVEVVSSEGKMGRSRQTTFTEVIVRD
tara:strand:- start:7 stop:240 length:234 start_codon:yes stop_codon:yes gene_type:complete